MSPARKAVQDAFELRLTDIDSSLTLWHEALGLLSARSSIEDRADIDQIGAVIQRLRKKYSVADSLLNSSFELYRQVDDLRGMSIIHMEKGNLFNDLAEYDSAGVHYLKSYDLKKQILDEEGLAILLLNLGTIEDIHGNYHKATEYYLKGLPLAQKQGLPETESSLYHNLSIIEYNQKNIDKAISYQKSALPINQKHGFYRNEAMNRVCLATYFAETNQLDTAEMHARTAMTLCDRQNYDSGRLYVLSALGDIYQKRKDYQASIQYYSDILDEIDSFGDAYIKAETLEKIGITLTLEGDHVKALACLQDALHLYKELRTKKEIYETHEEIAECYNSLGDSDSAYEHILESNVYRDSVFSEESANEVARLNAQFETTQKEMRITVLQKEAEVDDIRLMALMAVVGLISVVLVSIVILLRKLRQKNKALNVQRNEIENLHDELKHRAGNDFASIVSLLELQANRLQEGLLKDVLVKNKNRVVAFAKVYGKLASRADGSMIELSSHLSEIIDGLKECYGDFIPAENIHFESSVIYLADNIVKHIGIVLNELVTNSIKHAFNDSDDPKIWISIIKLEDQLFITYKDNGPGITEPVITQVKPNRAKTLGNRLIMNLVTDLGGTVHHNRGNDFSAQITISSDIPALEKST